MFYLILAIAAVGITYYTIWSNTDSWAFGLISSIFVGAMTLFLSMSLGMVATCNYNTPNSTTQNIIYEESVPLINFEFSDNTFLVCSTANSTLKYSYTIEDEFGQRIKTINANSCYIVYGNEPSIQKFTNESKSKIVNWLFCPGRYFYLITLPEGSAIGNQE